MKRSEALQPLSRDHHQALFVAHQLKRADEESKADAAEAFVKFWNDHGSRHFRDEEEILLPSFAAYGDAHDPLIARVLTDHVEIRHRARRLSGASGESGEADSASSLPPAGSTEDLNQVGELLADHVRREERELFPMIEAGMPPEAAEELASIFIAAEQERGSC